MVAAVNVVVAPLVAVVMVSFDGSPMMVNRSKSTGPASLPRSTRVFAAPLALTVTVSRSAPVTMMSGWRLSQTESFPAPRAAWRYGRAANAGASRVSPLTICWALSPFTVTLVSAPHATAGEVTAPLTRVVPPLQVMLTAKVPVTVTVIVVPLAVAVTAAPAGAASPTTRAPVRSPITARETSRWRIFTRTSEVGSSRTNPTRRSVALPAGVGGRDGSVASARA